jgi:iron complex outermembrane receptor protein
VVWSQSSQLPVHGLYDAGLLRFEQHEGQNFNDLWLGLSASGVANPFMDVVPARTATSYSGDLRAIRTVSDDTHQRELTFDVRGRHAIRNYGGDSITDMGPISLYDYRSLPEPALVFTDQSRDNVQQTGAGINYGERWRTRASLSVGMLWTDYRRSLDKAHVPSSSERASKLLPTVSFALTSMSIMPPFI